MTWPRHEGEGPNPSGLCMCGCGSRAPIAPCSNSRKGWVTGKPLKFLPGHQRRKSPHEYLADEATGCWIWQRARNDLGYGQTTVDGRVVYAHRVFYERANGPIAEGLVIDHLCANPSCVNPEHLEAVTHGENLRRGSRDKQSIRARLSLPPDDGDRELDTDLRCPSASQTPAAAMAQAAGVSETFKEAA